VAVNSGSKQGHAAQESCPPLSVLHRQCYYYDTQPIYPLRLVALAGRLAVVQVPAASPASVPAVATAEAVQRMRASAHVDLNIGSVMLRRRWILCPNGP
jgi:hypothetical protein